MHSTKSTCAIGRHEKGGWTHRASPQKIKGEALPGGKVALFYTLGADNAATRQWVDYQVESGLINDARVAGQVLPAPTPEFRFM